MSVALRGTRSAAHGSEPRSASTHHGNGGGPVEPVDPRRARAPGRQGWPMPRQASSVRLHARSARCARSTSNSSAGRRANVSRGSRHCSSPLPPGPHGPRGARPRRRRCCVRRPRRGPGPSTRTAQRMGQCSTARRWPRSHSPPATLTRTGVSTAGRSSRSTRTTRSSSHRAAPGRAARGRPPHASRLLGSAKKKFRFVVDTAAPTLAVEVLPWSAAARRCAGRNARAGRDPARRDDSRARGPRRPLRAACRGAATEPRARRHRRRGKQEPLARPVTVVPRRPRSSDPGGPRDRLRVGERRAPPGRPRPRAGEEGQRGRARPQGRGGRGRLDVRRPAREAIGAQLRIYDLKARSSGCTGAACA